VRKTSIYIVQTQVDGRSRDSFTQSQSVNASVRWHHGFSFDHGHLSSKMNSEVSHVTMPPKTAWVVIFTFQKVV